MNKVWLTFVLVFVIIVFGSIDQWFVAEKSRLEINKLLMLKELKASIGIQKSINSIKDQALILDKLPTLERARKSMITYFDLLDQELDIKALHLPKVKNHLLTMDVQLFFKKVDAQVINKVLNFELPLGMSEIRYFTFNPSLLEVRMRWYIPVLEQL